MEVTIKQKYCDWHDDGETLSDRTIPFKDGNETFELDLCKECRMELRSGARRRKRRKVVVATNGHTAPKRKRKRQPEPSAMREWARSQGIDVSDHGRVPLDVEQRYKEAVLN